MKESLIFFKKIVFLITFSPLIFLSTLLLFGDTKRWLSLELAMTFPLSSFKKDEL